MLKGKLSRSELQRIAKFGVVGFSGVFVNLAISEVFFRFVLLPLPAEIVQFAALFSMSERAARLALANGIGVGVSIFTNFLLNDRWTWGDRQKGGRREWFRRLVKYYVAASAAGLLQVFVTLVSLEFVWQHLPLEIAGTKLDSTLSICTGIAAGMIINFLASHFWAFKEAEDA